MMTLPESIIVIDPGLRDTAVIVYTNGRITHAETFHTDTSTDMAGALERARSISERVCALAVNTAAATIVIESYRDIPGHLRQVSNRWMTPLLLGWLVSSLDDIAANIVWQDPEHVMRSFSPHMGSWKRRIFGIIPGDDKLTNEHLRSCGAHLLAHLIGGDSR